MPKKIVLNCPECGALMVLKRTKRFQYPKGGDRLFWGCSRWHETSCTGIVGAHPDGLPVGVPVDKAVREARMRAHAAFDIIWQRNNLTRKQAYSWLGRHLGKEHVHIGDMDEAECDQVIELALVLVGRIEEAETEIITEL